METVELHAALSGCELFKRAEWRRLMLDAHRVGFDIIERLCLLLRERIQSAYGAMEKV